MIKSAYLFFFFYLCSYSILLAQLYSDSISVNFFLIDECRISQNISGEINHVYETFAGEPFTFQAYFPNTSSTEKKVADFVSDYNIEFSTTSDHNKEKTIYYGASIAPEVVVYDEKYFKVLYRGRIDNSYESIGSRRRVITSRDLREALQSIVDQTEITKLETQAIGCFLNLQKP